MSGPVSVFDGACLRADLFQPEGKRLFVSFRHRVQADGAFDVPRPARSFTKQGYAHLHIQSRLNDWYINAETAALEAALAAATAGYGRRVAMGFSMGGYGALRFSSVLDLRHVLLVTPQFSIHPDVVPFDRRFRASATGFDPAMADLETHGRRQLAGVILADPFRPLDMANARLIQGVFRRLSLARAPGGGHQASKVLNAGGQFGAFQAALLDAPIHPRTIIDLHKRGRRVSPAYWSALGELARKHGHLALSRHALAQAAELRANEAL